MQRRLRLRGATVCATTGEVISPTGQRARLRFVPTGHSHGVIASLECPLAPLCNRSAQGQDTSMIRDEDAAFHAADAAHPTWAETNYFGFYSGEAHLNVGVYALFRTNLGTVTSSICMNSQRAVTHWEADFCDMRAAIPIPQP